MPFLLLRMRVELLFPRVVTLGYNPNTRNAMTLAEVSRRGKI